jgi:hypothetical protein
VAKITMLASIRTKILGNIRHLTTVAHFGQCFYVIPDVEAEVQSLELLNYAQITVVRGGSYLQRYGA